MDPKAFRDYLSDRMSGEERNAFEKELQKDPFAEEALEGLSSIGEEKLNEDLKDLQSRLQGTGTGRNHRIVLYRVAAAVAGLLLVTSAYLLFDQKIRDLKSDRVARVENAEKKMPSAMEQGSHQKDAKKTETAIIPDSNREGNIKSRPEKPLEGKLLHLAIRKRA